MQAEWDQARLQQFIDDGIEEGAALDYKAADSLGRSDGKKSEITKDVSAFANSDGGIIIYGIAEHQEPDKQHLPEKIDAIDRAEFSKEWLDQVISTIRPSVDGLHIYPVKLDNDPNRVAYVVEIPKSTTAHQARDHRYYKRYNFMAVAMEDYEVRDVMNRATMPNIEVDFAFILLPGHTGTLHEYRLMVVVNNQGQQPVNRFKVMIMFPNYVGSNIICDSHENMTSGNDSMGHFMVAYRSRSSEYLFPKDMVEIGSMINLRYRMTVESHLDLMSRNDEPRLRWVLYADNMLPKQGSIPFSELNQF